MAMVHALACFLGSFLLFSLEPMLGKAMTPRFGGGAQVWMTCLLFFQGTLLLGYLWAFGIVRRLAPGNQVRVHGLLLAAALAQLLAQGVRGLPFLPFWRQTQQNTANPLHLLAVLGGASALALVALAATAPLVQSWFAQDRPQTSPYRLYAASNLGSLAGLLCYPFVVEPLLGLPAQAWVATGLFALYAGATLVLGRPGTRAALPALPSPLQPWTRQAPWVLASAVGVLLLMGASNHLVMLAAAIPLIWVGPLALYLLTFALVFEGRPWWETPRAAGLWLALLAVCAGVLARYPAGHFWPVLAADHGVVFFGGLLCHGFLHRRRPEPSGLVGYYLILAVGGVVGGLLMALVAPLVFDRRYEYGLGLLLAAAVGVWALGPGLWRRWALVPALAALAAGAWLLWTDVKAPGRFFRDYYGVVRVANLEGQRVLMNGRVIHGSFDPLHPDRPTTYYSPDSGVGRTLASLRARRGTLRVGVVGMGIGTLGLYAKAGDAWTFYEISPAVLEVAGSRGTLFPLIRTMPAAPEVLLGDGRRLLDQERAAGRPRGFDLLVVDAFTNDVVPWHLLTLEALDLYLHHLAPDGVLAIHISNPMPLDRVVLSLARARNLYGGLHGTLTGAPTFYALLARKPAPLQDPAILEGLFLGFGPRVFAGHHPQSALVRQYSSDRPWTDERSALSLLLFRKSSLPLAFQP
jgi:SAM-dependent methyltransferase